MTVRSGETTTRTARLFCMQGNSDFYIYLFFLNFYLLTSIIKIWTKNSDEEAAQRIIEREKNRIKIRLEGHYGNNVWEKRDDPPSTEEWNKPLPGYMIERQKQSYLSLYANNQSKRDEETENQLKSMSVQANLVNMAPTCTIM